MNKEWDKAKSIWILEVLQLQPKRKRFSSFGDENEFFISFINHFQRINYICANHSCKRLFYSYDELYFDFDKNMNIELNINVEKECSFCACFNNIKIFENKPCWLFA